MHVLFIQKYFLKHCHVGLNKPTHKTCANQAGRSLSDQRSPGQEEEGLREEGAQGSGPSHRKACCCVIKQTWSTSVGAPLWPLARLLKEQMRLRCPIHDLFAIQVGYKWPRDPLIQ